MSALRPPPGGAVVRMYNDSGFGDCFLLAFPRDDGGVATMLIDCGEWKRRKDVLTAISSAVAEAAGNRIDVLVATHEHTDHLSGFNSARDVWDGVAVGQVWLSWLDDPANDLAGRLRSAYGKKLRAVAAALDRWEASLTGLSATAAAAARKRIASVRDVLAFEAAEVHPAAAGTATIAQAIEYLRTKGEEDVRYLHPGQKPLTIPGVSNVRVYVLGPPEDEDAIRDLDPDPDDPETYEIALAMTADAAFLVAAEYGAADTEPEVSEIRRTLELSYPFERHHRVPVDDARATFASSYFRRDAWRRVDADWLETAEQLALHLNSYTNNTSLALAIELVDAGRVLLFPADAQVGNWLSWHDITWEGDDGQPITARDLLARTVLYKVGHHGSHNATLRDLGLELMQHEDLIALIPVDEEFARSQHRPWNMPFPPLYRALRRRARGRVLRSDRVRLPSKPVDVSDAVWARFRADTMRSSGKRRGDGYWQVIVR